MLKSHMEKQACSGEKERSNQKQTILKPSQATNTSTSFDIQEPDGTARMHSNFY